MPSCGLREAIRPSCSGAGLVVASPGLFVAADARNANFTMRRRALHNNIAAAIRKNAYESVRLFTELAITNQGEGPDMTNKHSARSGSPTGTEIIRDSPR